jgi:hypothetical protein
MTTVHCTTKGLPVVLKPADDELLSSWIARHAQYYNVSPLAMLRHCLPDATSLRAADLRLNSDQAARIALIFHSAPAEIRRMSHADIPQDAVRLLAPKSVQTCLPCAQDNARRNVSAARLRSSLEGWRITCRSCGSRLIEVGERGQPRLQERGDVFAHLWRNALRGQDLFENAIIDNSWPWASPTHILRLLLVRRSCKSVDLSKGIDKGCTVNLVVPSFDETVCRLNLGPLRSRSLVLPISIRPALLAAVSIVVDRGPEAIDPLAEATIGGYRTQFDKIVSQLQAEARIRQAVSQLLQS